jgi:lipopolysaccharide/colanic/teichoic acid biosynthesis glycosyltransferase
MLIRRGSGDDRITRFGGFLRCTSLDELPWLFNILRGDVTLVAPRPRLEWEAEIFASEFDERFAVRPDLAGLWQMIGSSIIGSGMLQLDDCYARHQTLGGGVAIVARAVPALLRGDGAR